MKVKRLNVFDFKDPSEFLRVSWGAKKLRYPKLSVRGWAQKMGFRHPSSLEHFLSGRRLINLNNSARLTRGLALRGAEKKYFVKLIEFVNSKDNLERDELEFQLYQLRKYSTHTELDREAFKLISEWHHFAIAALTRHQDFRNDPVWISQKLIGKIKPEQVDMAIRRLLQAGVLKTIEGKLVVPAVRTSFWTALADVEMQVLFHQRQVLHLAMQEVMKPEIRNIAESAFMTIDSTKLLEAQNLVREFRTELAQLLEKNPGDSTYALTIQLFPVVHGKA